MSHGSAWASLIRPLRVGSLILLSSLKSAYATLTFVSSPVLIQRFPLPPSWKRISAWSPSESPLPPPSSAGIV